jgi:hypothetical protein
LQPRRLVAVIPTPFLIALLLVALAGGAKASEKTIIGFNAARPGHARLTDHRTGKSYVMSLEPDPDADGRVSVVDLVLMPSADRGGNLVEPPGNYRGLQPYDFAALDLRQGAARSVFGPVRRITIRGTARKLVVRIDDFALRRFPDRPAGELGSVEIKSLRLSASLD